MSDSVLSETRTQARDAIEDSMARAYYEWATTNEGEESRWDAPGVHQGFARARAEVMLDALLSPELRQSLLTLLGETEKS